MLKLSQVRRDFLIYNTLQYVRRYRAIHYIYQQYNTCTYAFYAKTVRPHTRRTVTAQSNRFNVSGRRRTRRGLFFSCYFLPRTNRKASKKKKKHITYCVLQFQLYVWHIIIIHNIVARAMVISASTSTHLLGTASTAFA